MNSGVEGGGGIFETFFERYIDKKVFWKKIIKGKNAISKKV